MLFFFLGYKVLFVSKEQTATFFEMCRLCHVSPKNAAHASDGGLYVTCSMLAVSRLLRATAENSVFSVLRSGGLPILLHRLCRRPGILLGTFLGILVLFSSRLFLWEIEIIGNEILEENEIYASLENAGLKKGSFLPGLSADGIAIALRRQDPRISYVAVYIKGTVATVQIKEAVSSPDQPASPANLVAKCDAVITMPLIYEGVCLVKEGDVVRAGQLLAGGLLNTENNGLRVTRAAGQVLARTVRTYQVRVDFDHIEKVYTGTESTEISLLFFSKEQKVFKMTGKVGESCDIIETVKWLSVGNGRYLPFGYTVRQGRQYRLESAKYTVTEAREIAFAKLSAILAGDSAQRQLLSKHTEIAMDAEGITLTCTVIAEEDIAVTQEFSPAGL